MSFHPTFGLLIVSERLEKELRESLSPHVSNRIRVIPPPYGADTAWFGGKIIGNVSYLFVS